MLSDEVLDKVIDRLTRRIEQGNEYVLEQIGKTIKKIGSLTPTRAMQLQQMLKYGGDYNKITKKLAEITKLNVQDIKKIFEEVAKNDYEFAKKFYYYRNKEFIPYKENLVLKTQVDALANMTANKYINLTNTLAFTKKVNNKVVYTELARQYEEVIDKAVLSAAQGKSTFDEQMHKTIKELADSGIKTVNYAGKKLMRVDSAVRLQMHDALRQLHNEQQIIMGKQFDADGVEISVHIYPAPDHAEVQGKQFSTNKFDVNGNLIEKGEFEKFQTDEEAVSYDGVRFAPEFKGHDRRSIGQYNCRHRIFPIILGVSKPEYTNEQLKAIRDNNIKGFEFDGKHYTNYEGTQLQRQLETEIRKQKDQQVIAKAAGDTKLVGETQKNITALTNKYKELSKASGLPTRMERMRVADYRRVAVDKMVKDNNINYIDYYEQANKIQDDNKRFEKNMEIADSFDKIYQPIYDSLNINEQEALKKYSGIYYKDINKTTLGLDIDDTDNYLNYGSIDDYKKQINTWVDNIDSALDKSKLQENTILWRGTLNKYYENYKEGDILDMKMYNSTSLNRRVAETFMWNKPDSVALKIKAPAGTKSMYMDTFGFGEQEMLLGRKQKYRFIKAYEEYGMTETFKDKKIKIIELEAIK